MMEKVNLAGSQIWCHCKRFSWLARVIIFLQSTNGQQVRSFITDACPPQTSQSKSGIAVCRDVYMEFSWQKVGDRKTPPKQYGSADGEANVPAAPDLSDFV